MKEVKPPKNNVIAIAINKGGVAKTTSTAAIGSVLASKGFKVLFIDLDGQGNLSNTFLESVSKNTVADLLNDGIISIVHTKEGLDIIPCDMSIMKVDDAMTEPGDRLILKQRIASLREQYDFILMDCPPAYNHITINALSAADYIFAPCDTSEDGKKGIMLLADACLSAAPPKMIGGVFITLYDARPRINREIVQELRQKYGTLIFDTPIRYSCKVKEARKENLDIVTYDPKSKPAEDYVALVEEILERIKTGGNEAY